MRKTKSKWFSTVVINLAVLLFLVVLIEIFFGGWVFSKNNMNALNIVHDAELKYDVRELYTNDNKDIIYTRDKYGFRGRSSFNNPALIDVLTIGGSTTDQRHIEDGKTWQDVIEKNLKSNGINYNVANAGIDGQSTFGHIKNFKLWFPNVPNLKPKIILFYVGINDFYIESGASPFDMMVHPASLKNKIKDYSAVYNLYRKIKGVIKARQSQMSDRKIDFSKYHYTSERLLEEKYYPDFFGNKLYEYKERLNILVKLTKQYGAEPVFVTQPTMRYKLDKNGKVFGIDDKQELGKYVINGADYFYLLTEMNKVIYDVAQTNDLLVVELTKLNIWEQSDFYDFSHMPPNGAKKVGDEISEKLIQKIKSK